MADAGAVAGPRARRSRACVSATPFVLQQALFTAPGGGATGGLLRGVDLDAPAVRDAIAAQLKLRQPRPARSRAAEPALLLGRELARTPRRRSRATT